jgi:plastocyanin
MTDSLDSRALRRTDCYAQRFMKAGKYAYNILPLGGDCMTGDRPFTIEVVDGPKVPEMQQHTVLVRTEGGRFRIAETSLKINAGDLVLWNCVDSRAVPYAVVGDKEFFASHRMLNECGFSHAFGTPGEYRWMDAHGSGLGGVIRVKDPGNRTQADCERWQKALSKGTLVMITGAKAEPNEVDIMVGQTVFFAVTKSTGISITDERLVKRTEEGKPSKPEARPKLKSARSRR